MFSFFFGAALCFILFDLKRHGRDRLWLLPPLLWLWGNFHGGYIIGFGFIAAFALGEALNKAFGLGETIIPRPKTRKLVIDCAAFAGGDAA